MSRLVVRALLVSRDVHTIELLSQASEKIGVHVEVSDGPDAAIQKLCRAKYEGVIVDVRDRNTGMELMRKQRHMTSHKSAITTGIVNHQEEFAEAFRAGANFVIMRPLSPSAILRTLRASYPMMVREKRRYYRFPLQIHVSIATNSRPDFAAKSVNISEGGLALQCTTPVNVGERLNVKMTLPGTGNELKLASEVCWNDNAGRVGLQFRELPADTKEALQSWIGERFEESMVGDLQGGRRTGESQ